MKLHALGLVATLIAGVVLLNTLPASPLTVNDPLEGIYSLSSKGYSGSATIRKHGDCYVMQTQIGQKNSKDGLAIEANKAVGLKRGDILSFGWTSAGTPGVSVYAIGKDGTLTGHWSTLGGVMKAIPETLKKIGPIPAPLEEDDD